LATRVAAVMPLTAGDDGWEDEIIADGTFKQAIEMGVNLLPFELDPLAGTT